MIRPAGHFPPPAVRPAAVRRGSGSTGSGSTGSGSTGSGSTGSGSTGSGSTGSGSTGSGSTGSGSFTPSPNGTRGIQVVDATGGVWTFDGTKTLRDGVWMGQGSASEYLYVNNTVYAIVFDGSIYRWNNGWLGAGNDIAALTGGSTGSGSTGSGSTGSGSTGSGSTGSGSTGSGSSGSTGSGSTGSGSTGSGSTGSGSTGSGSTGSGSFTPSPNGTRGIQVVDATGGVWTFDGTKTLRDGVWMGQGSASEYLYVNNTVYAIVFDGSIYRWNNGWLGAGNDIAALTGGSTGSGSTGSGSTGSGSTGSGSTGSGSTAVALRAAVRLAPALEVL